MIKRICVFCGSHKGTNSAYALAARELGEILAREKIALVYGGGSVGLMGEISNTVLRHGGEVTGIIPRVLAKKEAANMNVTRLHIVGSMHERKALMEELSDSFIALPGGIGTLEEFAEMLTWFQLGIHRKPCALLNIEGFFDTLIAFLDHALRERFIKADHRSSIIIDTRAEHLLERLRAYHPAARAVTGID